MTINRRTLYELTDEDRQVLAAARGRPSIATNHYVDTPDSGTWYMRDPRDERHRGYEQLYERWIEAGEPEGDFELDGRLVQPRWGSGGTLPDFLHRHGFTFIPWQESLALSMQRVQAVVGGFGSAKSTYAAMAGAYFAITLPGFQFLCLAPLTVQAKEMYEYLLTTLQGTPFWEKFVISEVSSPYPRIIIGHSEVGYNTLTFMSAEKEAKKTKTLELDWIVFDQAEDQVNLFETQINLRTRLRGMVRGRPRMCRITYLANSADNDDFWQIYDRAEEDPERHLSITVSYEDNPYLTEQQRADFRDAVGDDQELIDQHLHGHRIEYPGDVFPKALIHRCRETELDQLMERCTTDDQQFGYEVEQEPVVGAYRWVMPASKVARYAVFADGGSSNPPRRSAGVILVIDLTQFPREPAKLWEFHWVYGHGSIMPFLTRLAEVVEKFKAHGHVFLDTTGPNKGLAETFTALYAIDVNPVDFASTKFYHLNSLKVLLENRKIVYPWGIRGIRQQFGKYKLPDDKIPQDIVMTFLMAASYLQPQWGGQMEESDEKSQDSDRDQPRVARLGRNRVPRNPRR